jgi:hypothetical protein
MEGLTVPGADAVGNSRAAFTPTIDSDEDELGLDSEVDEFSAGMAHEGLGLEGLGLDDDDLVPGSPPSSLPAAAGLPTVPQESPLPAIRPQLPAARQLPPILDWTAFPSVVSLAPPPDLPAAEQSPDDRRQLSYRGPVASTPFARLPNGWGEPSN